MSQKAADLVFVIEFIRRLSRPFDKTRAFKLGIIDSKGKLLKKPSTPEEKDAYTHFDRLVFNVKRIMEKFGLKRSISSYAVALWLMREHESVNPDDDQVLQEGVLKAVKEASLEEINEMIANSTGAAVAGTGDSGVHWSKRQPKIGPAGKGRKKYGQPVDWVTFIRRKTREMRALKNNG